MKKLVKLGCVSGFLVIGSVFLFSDPAQATVATTESDASPRSLYINNCSRCHGADGRANTAKGRELDADDISGGVSTSKIIRIVTNGKGDMPSFKRKLTTAQIKSIAGYAHSL